LGNNVCVFFFGCNLDQLEEAKKDISKRDQRIEELLRRIEQLEKEKVEGK